MSEMYKIEFQPNQVLYNELSAIILSNSPTPAVRQKLIIAMITREWNHELFGMFQAVLYIWKSKASISELSTNNNEIRYTFMEKRIKELLDKARKQEEASEQKKITALGW